MHAHIAGWQPGVPPVPVDLFAGLAFIVAPVPHWQYHTFFSMLLAVGWIAAVVDRRCGQYGPAGCETGLINSQLHCINGQFVPLFRF